ncbi:MAG: hypothetical protein WD180_12835 [Pseudohongiellaceae bacterium]
MQKILIGLDKRLAPAEDLFFTWLVRVIVAALLVGSAWIDDAPPLELGAMIIAVYVAVRVVMQAGAFVSAIPLENRVLKVLVAIVALGLLVLTFPTVAILVSTLALSAVG